MSGTEARIDNLDGLVRLLSAADREVFDRIYEVRVATARMRLPESMVPWVETQFGDVEKVVEQRTVRVTNRITLEEAIFNQLRARRGGGMAESGEALHSAPTGYDPFADPYADTPEDSFGRVEGTHCVTGSNIAKYEGFHGVVIFKEADPLRFEREHVADYIETGRRWAERAHLLDPEAKYYLFMWNCGGRAGASAAHGHAQVVLGRGGHYAKVEHLRRCGLSYRQRYGASYFDDLCRVHAALGCGFEKDGVRVMAHLTPVKEKEVILMARESGGALEDRLYEVLACLRDRLAVSSFNVALLMPPIAPAEEDWDGFPTIARVVDRGPAGRRTSDIGSIELYASTVVSSDPFEVARVMKGAMG